MWNEPTKERLAKIPKLYETENIARKDKPVFLHFFLGSADWYICEADGEDRLGAGPGVALGDRGVAENDLGVVGDPDAQVGEHRAEAVGVRIPSPSWGWP